MNWGTAPFTWTAGNTGPVTYTMTDQNGFQLSIRLGITRTGGTAVSGYPDDLSGTMGTGTSLQIQWDSNSGSSGIGESTNTATLELLNGATPLAANALTFRINDIDAVDNNNTSDRCDFVTVTGNAGNPTLSYVQTNAASRSVFIGPGTAAGSIGTIAANQAACLYTLGAGASPSSNADDNGTILVTYPAGTSTATITYDEAIENVLGVTSRDAPARGIGIWDTTAVTVNNTISLTKSASATSYTAVGQVITYTYVVTNNGPLPINTSQNIQIQDSKIGTFACGTISSAIASGGTVTCTNTYTVTAADIAAPAGVTNTAIAGVGTTGQAFASRLQSPQVSVTVPNKAIDAVNDSFTATPINGLSGGTTATVFSNDTLSGASFANAAVTPSIFNTGGLTGVSINANGTIRVPAATTAGTYTVTYRICEAAAPTNCDTATATILVSAAPSTGGTSCTGTNLATNGGFETPAQSGVGSFMLGTSAVPGWSTTDTNIEVWTSGFNGTPSHTGNQFAEINANVAGTLTQTTGTIRGRAQLDIYWAHRARQGTDTARMTLTDNGGASTNSGNFSATTTAWVVNSMRHVTSATATSATLAFTAVSTGSGSVSVGNFLDTVEVCQTYITLTKSEFSRTDTDGSASDTAGDILTYRYAIANPSGNNRSLASVSITDDKLGTLAVSAPTSGDTNTNGFLDPGETWNFDVNYTLTQANIDTGTLTNIAFVTASTGSNTLRSNDSTVTATFTAKPKLSLVKTATLQKKPGNTNATRAQLGDTILYTYAVTNTGNVAMGNIQVADVHSGSGAFATPANETLTDTAPTGDSTDTTANNGAWSVLAPKDVVTFTTLYTVTQTDIDNQ